jgi:hypothetical protein
VAGVAGVEDVVGVAGVAGVVGAVGVALKHRCVKMTKLKLCIAVIMWLMIPAETVHNIACICIMCSS